MIKVVSAKKKSNRLLEEMESLSRIRTALMNDDIAKEICSDLGIGSWFLASVPIRYEKVKVTAKTVNGNIILSPKLAKKPFDILMRYVIHELVHAIQHIKEYGKKQTDKKKDYLNREDELEAFQYQVKFDEEHRGEEEAEKYVDKLLSFHDIPDERREEKKEELMDKAASQ